MMNCARYAAICAPKQSTGIKTVKIQRNLQRYLSTVGLTRNDHRLIIRIKNCNSLSLLQTRSIYSDGHCHCNGHNCTHDHHSSTSHTVDKQQISKIEELAISGDIDSIAEIGRMYLDGEKVVVQESSLHVAQKWLEIAAENDHIESQYLLGMLMLDIETEKEANMKLDSQQHIKTSDDVLNQIKQMKINARKRRKDSINKQKQTQMQSSNGEDTSIAIAEKEAMTGMDWIKLAASHNHAKAMCYLGNRLLSKLTKEDIQEAVAWYSKAAELGNADAMFNLGSIYFEGKPIGAIDRDEQRSFELFTQAADLGDASSLFWIGHCYMSGEGGCEIVDAGKALSYLHKAIIKGHVKAHYYLATLYRSGLTSTASTINKDRDLFLHHLNIAVEKYDDDALYCMADMYMFGHEGFEVDQVKARQLYEQASEYGHVEALLSLGALHYGGIGGCTVDKAFAFNLYSQAAELGSLDAWRNLASMHFTGDGVPKSEETAREIMRLIFSK